MFRAAVKTLDRSCNSIIYVPLRTAKTEIPVKWTRPVKVPNYNPQKAGDLESLREQDLKKCPSIYEKSEEFQKASDIVKRLYTLEFQSKYDVIGAMRNSYAESVNRHNLDYKSPEAGIAAMTATIRHLQIYIASCTQKKPPREIRVYIKELIEKRTGRLRRLRELDYKRYEWLLEKLNLVYKPKPNLAEKVERKKSLRRLTDLYCEKLRQEKFDQYREHLESQQEEFLEKKLESFKWIQEKEKEYGIIPSITDEEIKNVSELLENLKLKRKVTVEAD